MIVTIVNDVITFGVTLAGIVITGWVAWDIFSS